MKHNKGCTKQRKFPASPLSNSRFASASVSVYRRVNPYLHSACEIDHWLNVQSAEGRKESNSFIEGREVSIKRWGPFCYSCHSTMRCNEWNENGGRLHGEDEGGLSFALQAWQGHWRKERETEVGHEVGIYAICIVMTFRFFVGANILIFLIIHP